MNDEERDEDVAKVIDEALLKAGRHLSEILKFTIAVGSVGVVALGADRLFESIALQYIVLIYLALFVALSLLRLRLLFRGLRLPTKGPYDALRLGWRLARNRRRAATSAAVPKAMSMQLFRDISSAQGAIEFVILGGLGVIYLAVRVFEIRWSDGILVGLVALIFMIAWRIQTAIVFHRIQMGTFGEDAAEARQMIRFLLSKEKDGSFGDDGGSPSSALLPNTPESGGWGRAKGRTA